jgi:thioredoxin 1
MIGSAYKELVSSMATQQSPNLVDLNGSNVREILSQDGIVLVECWASSCGACSVLNPIFEHISDTFPQHNFAKLDTIAEDELSKSLEILHVPSLLLYRDGILLFKQAGNFDEDRLIDIINQAEALDMEMVRADLDREVTAE